MPEPIKHVFNRAVIKALSAHLSRVWPELDTRGFIRMASHNLDELELKQRSKHITDALEHYLPTDFSHACAVLLAALHPEDSTDLKSMKTDALGLRGWVIMPMADYIARRGLQDFDRSMDALQAMTRRFTTEFAVRPLINADWKRALKHVTRWSQSDNEHVRRLASEGTRPRLPWGEHIRAFIADPTPMLPILERLKEDPSEYVRRSVANHLNDIAKDHPHLVAEVVEAWWPDASSAGQRLLKHACRGLVKKGDPRILTALGYGAHTVKEDVDVTAFTLKPARVRVGESLNLTVQLRSLTDKTQTFIVDYVVYHRRANGVLSPKVFKWKGVTLQPGESVTLTKSHSFKPVTTRVYYPGTHQVAVQINGQVFHTLDFQLVKTRESP